MLKSYENGSCMVPAMLVLCLGMGAGSTRAHEGKITEEEAARLGVEAYVYGYPLVTMESTRRVMTNVATREAIRGPMGSFTSARTYPTAAFRDVTAPNADTLYSVAWLDLAREPYILSLPEEDGRYYLMPILSGWTDVFEVPEGKPPDGGPGQGSMRLFTGPGSGRASSPEGVAEDTNPPTSLVWILGRTCAPARRRITRRSMLSKIGIPSSP